MNAEGKTVEGQPPLAAASSAPTGKLSDPERWVEEYGDYLFKYAVSRLRDPAKAEDMVQEAFLAALKGAKGFQGRSAEKSWLVGILKNKICDHFRKASRYTQPRVERLNGSSSRSFMKKYWRKYSPCRSSR